MHETHQKDAQVNNRRRKLRNRLLADSIVIHARHRVCLAMCHQLGLVFLFNNTLLIEKACRYLSEYWYNWVSRRPGISVQHAKTCIKSMRAAHYQTKSQPVLRPSLLMIWYFHAITTWWVIFVRWTNYACTCAFIKHASAQTCLTYVVLISQDRLSHWIDHTSAKNTFQVR